jgi:hypothetical protein
VRVDIGNVDIACEQQGRNANLMQARHSRFGWSRIIVAV